MLISVLSLNLNNLLKTLNEQYHRLDLWYFISFIFGIIFYFNFNCQLTINFLISTILILFILLIKVKKHIVLKFFIINILWFLIAISAAKYRTTNLHLPAFPNGIIVKIAGDIESLYHTARGVEVILRVKQINYPIIIKKVKISFGAKFITSLSVGKEVIFQARIYNIAKNILPRSYDFILFSSLAEIHATGYAMGPADIIAVKKNLNFYINELKIAIQNKIILYAGETAGPFIVAFLLGNTKSINKALLSDIRNAGISHILCISGLHLALVGMIIFSSMRFLMNLSNFLAYKLNIKTIAAVISLICSYLYLLLSDLQIAATRAFIMSAIFILSLIINRKMSSLRALGIAVIIILIPRPEYVFHPSFQLSFAAVLSLIMGFEFFQNNSKNFIIKKNLFNKIKLYFISNIYSSFLASIITAPIVFHHFYIFSTYSIINNLVAVPLMGFCLMPLGLLAIISMVIGIEEYIIKLLAGIVEFLIKFISFSNSLPSSVIYIGNISNLSILIFYLGFLWLAIWQSQTRKIGIILMFISLLLMYPNNKPDYIFDYSLFALGVKSNNNELKIYSNKFSNFNLKFWSNWFGQKTATLLPLQDRLFINNNGISLSINYRYNDNCLPADIQININKVCPAKILSIDKALLNQTPLITLYCSKGKCDIENYKNFMSH